METLPWLDTGGEEEEEEEEGDREVDKEEEMKEKAREVVRKRGWRRRLMCVCNEP